jgi:hypothetical protein
MLSDELLVFLRAHRGEAFTAGELRERIEWPGRVLPCHVQQALERKLLPEGAVAAKGRLRMEGRFVRACPRTRWCALEGAPRGFVTYTPGEGICTFGEEEEKPLAW